MLKIAAILAVATMSSSCAAQQPNADPLIAAAKVTESLSFSADSGRPVLIAQMNGLDVPVIFDTGSQGAVIAKSMADSMKLEVIGEALIGSPYGVAPKRAFIVSLGSLSLGGTKATRSDAVVIDDSQIPNDLKLIIGPNLFADHAVAIDFSAQTLSLVTEIAGDEAGWQKLDERGMLQTTLNIGAENIPVTVDTGNPGGVNLPKSIADRLGVTLTAIPGRKIKTIDAEFPLYEGMVDADATLGGVPLRLGAVIFTEIPSANAGSKALNGMRLIIDTPRRRWRLERIAD